MIPSKFTTTLGLFALLGTLILGSTPSAHAEDTNAPEKNAEEIPAKKGTYAADPTKVKFSEFKVVEIKATALPKKAQKPANQKSSAKIDEMLQAQLKPFFPNLKVIPVGGEFSTNNTERTLQISPSIVKIHLVSVGSRVWFGVMAGGSDIVMHVDYRDSSTGEIIAHPDFWKGNNAWSGGTTWGASDNQIRDAVVAQIINYTQLNR
jgi:hypothetical protein